MIKANFKLSKTTNIKEQTNENVVDNSEKDLTQSEFEDYIIKSGAKGSFMVYRSSKKDDELGLEEL